MPKLCNVVTMITLKGFMSRITIGSRELKTRLGTYLRHVQNGQSIIVTERGRPVAELRPVDIEAHGEEAVLDELVERGILTRQTKKPLPPFKPVRIKGRPLSKIIIEAREDRF